MTAKAKTALEKFKKSLFWQDVERARFLIKHSASLGAVLGFLHHLTRITHC